MIVETNGLFGCIKRYMSIYKDKKAYIVATVFGLSLIIIIPTVSFAQGINSKHVGLNKAGIKIALFKPHITHSQTHFGLVTNVSGSMFTLDSHIKNATTTFTVSTDAKTVFKKDGKSDVASDLVVGQHVMVMGLTSTSTNAIAARSVNIITHEPTVKSLKHVFKKQK